MTPTPIPVDMLITLSDGGAAIIARSASFGDIAIIILLAGLCAAQVLTIILKLVRQEGGAR